jgi:hypothetical protein
MKFRYFMVCCYVATISRINKYLSYIPEVVADTGSFTFPMNVEKRD